MDRNLPCAGFEHLAHNAQDISDVHGFEVRIGFLAHIVPADINLDVAFIIEQVGKARLAHDAFGHHAPRQADGFAFERVVFFQYVRTVKLLVIAHDLERIAAGVLKGLELIPPDLQQFAQFLLCEGPFLGRVHASLLVHVSLLFD